MGDMTFRMSQFQADLGFFQLIDDGFFLLYGPLFLAYIQSVIYKNYKISKKSWIHLLPYLLITGILILSFGVGQARPVSQIDLMAPPWYIYVISSFLYLHVLIYLVFGFKSLNNYRRIIKNQFSKIDHINLNWLSFTLKTMGWLTLISLLHNFLLFSGKEYIYGISLFLLLIFIFYFVNRVIFKALNQPEIFGGIDQNEGAKYSGSNLTDSQAKVYQNQLMDFLKKGNFYLNPQVSLHELAEKLNTSSKILSQVINQSFNKSFFDFINSFRIEEAQHIMKQSSDDKLTVLEVMYMVGFNSKSSFNTAFKRATGQTPSEFRKSL